MNREIKYRVWDNDSKRMRYLNTEHDFICFHSSGRGYYENMQTGPGEWFSGLMQYTGLKDKNGKEIYDGDLIRYKNGGIEEIDEVFFDKEYGTFEIAFNRNKSNSATLGFWIADLDEESSYEIIGNIYESEVTNVKD